MPRKPTHTVDGTSELVHAGAFETRLSLEVVKELNRRKIIHRLDERNTYQTDLYTLASSVSEAIEVLEDIAKKNKRVRL